MNVLIIDGHPDQTRLLSHLLDHYQQSLSTEVTARRINLRDLTFDPNLRRGYAGSQNWEPDLIRVADAIAACDHLVIGFPLWWGAEPALLKGLLDRVILPGFAFQYHRENPWWDRLLCGRSADLIVTMDTPPWYLKLVYGDAVIRRWRSQILGFCGFRPIRQYRFGPTRRGSAKKCAKSWKGQLARAATTCGELRRADKIVPQRDPAGFAAAMQDRLS